MARVPWTLLLLLCSAPLIRAESQEHELVAEESTYVPSAIPADSEGRYRLTLSYALNGGKPFSLEKDPLTGEIDYEKAPPVKILNITDRYDEDHPIAKVETHERDTGALEPNAIGLHDFLNLPAHYSSDRYDKSHSFPVIISGSYANTKVQSGANSYNIFNHRVDPVNKTPFYEPPRKIFASSREPTTSTTTTTTTPKTTTTTTTMRSTSQSTTTPRTTTEEPTTTTEQKPMMEEYPGYEDYETAQEEEQQVGTLG